MKTRLLLAGLIFTIISYGQQHTGVNGKVLDSLTERPLSFATISVFADKDTTLVTYRISNETGDFRITQLPDNKPLRILISFSGYAVYRKTVSLQKDETMELGTIRLTPDTKSLDEVLVTAERPPVIIRNDTIEFNASSFRILPNALLEDLLKKMPGLEIDREGNILANGRTVNRILIDGKAFFGNNIAMATRNLPADVIDKVQVTDDKEEIARNINGDLTNTGQVINLTLKKNIRKGWFGKLYAGLGTKDRYETGGIASIYRDTLQLSVLAFTNNVNRSGFAFNEVRDIGGFNRSGISSMSVTQRAGIGGFAVNGLSFGGTENGISRTTGGGFNFNHAPTKNKSFFIQYLAGGIANRLEEKRSVNEYLPDTVIRTFSLTQKTKSAATHNAAAGVDFKLSQRTTLSIRAGFAQTAANDDGTVQLDVSTNKSGQVSKGSGNRYSRPLDRSYTHNFFLTHRSKKGNVFNISSYLAARSSQQKNITEMNNEYYFPSYQNIFFNQLAQTGVNNILTNLNSNYTSVLSKLWTLRANAFFEYNKEQHGSNFFDKNAGQYNRLNLSKSGVTTRTQWRMNPSVSLSYKTKQGMITAGLGALWQPVTNSYGETIPANRQTITALLPEIVITRKRLSLQYTISVSMPSVAYQVPVTDSTNPFQIVYGSQELKPARRQTIRINNSAYLAGSRINYNYNMSLHLINNDVVLNRRIAGDGVQTIIPVNADGSFLFSSGAGIGKEYKNRNIQLNARIQANIDMERKKMYVNGSQGTASTWQFSPSASLSINMHDVVEFRPRYGMNISKTEYTDRYFRNLQVVTHILENELIVRFPKNLVWETNALYRYNSETAIGIPRTALYWNAGLTFLFFLRQTGNLRFHVYDLLGSNNGVSRSALQNQVVDLQTNVLGRYAEITFTYNIRNFSAAAKAGGQEPLLKL